MNENTYDNQMFAIMGREPDRMDIYHLSTRLHFWLWNNGYLVGDVIHLNPTISILSGLEDTGTYSTEGDDAWWNFVTMVHERWKR